MENGTGDFLFNLLLILVTARILAEVAVRLGSPAVIGELLAGVVLGPSLFGWMEPTEAIRLLAEIGVILLLFEVGMETDPRRLVNAGVASTIVAIGGFVLPFVFGYLFAHQVLGLGLLPSLFLGGTLTATSIGITVRVLSDLKAQQSREGVIVVGAAVIDDVLGVLLLALLHEYSANPNGVSLANTGRVALFIGIFFVLAPLVARLMSAFIRRVDEKSDIPGLIPTTITALVLFFAWLAHLAGAPQILGGFAAGLALSRRFFLPFGVALRSDIAFSRRVEEQIRPIVHLFTPIFFVFVGLSLNLREIAWGEPRIWILFGGLLLVAVAGKMLGAMFIREPLESRVAVGLAMIPRGEVGLIFAELGRVSGILDNELYAALILVIAVTTLLAPFALKGYYATPLGQRLLADTRAGRMRRAQHAERRAMHQQGRHAGRRR